MIIIYIIICERSTTWCGKNFKLSQQQSNAPKKQLFQEIQTELLCFLRIFQCWMEGSYKIVQINPEKTRAITIFFPLLKVSPGLVFFSGRFYAVVKKTMKRVKLCFSGDVSHFFYFIACFFEIVFPQNKLDDFYV